jgi:hypothetical protein
MIGEMRVIEVSPAELESVEGGLFREISALLDLVFGIGCPVFI